MWIVQMQKGSTMINFLKMNHYLHANWTRQEIQAFYTTFISITQLALERVWSCHGANPDKLNFNCTKPSSRDTIDIPTVHTLEALL